MITGGGSRVTRDRVVAVIAAFADGREQVGSGYLVSGRLVLTAAHCTWHKTTREPPIRRRVIRASDGAGADVAEVIADPDLDVAVLRLGSAPWTADLPAPVFAKVDRIHAGMLQDCQAIGFPLYQRDPEEKLRGTAELHGTIYQTDEAESGQLLMREPLIHPGPVTAPDDRRPHMAPVSPWDGLSGAVVFHRGVAIGVVVEHHPRQGDSALRAVTFDRLAARAVHADAARRLADALLLPPVESLPWAEPEPVAVYLKALIDWLGSDPWPRDRRFGGPMLTQAAIERKLRITASGEGAGLDLDADDLAQGCQRLVVLGGPGSGKTWLAKRTARRCAETALKALAGGAGLDEVEMPLYTTCSRLFTANGDIRQAAVSSALDELGDLGGSRLTAALRMFFTERNAPTLLVIDSLDEARGSSERLRQADTLPWRIVLTSRQNSWNNQLVIDERKSSHRVGELQPLSYPDDVEPFIHHWFSERPEWGRDLAAQIARRPGLQQAATVPLILALYCIVGGSEPLPEFRPELYDRVLNRMLTGRWRGSHDRWPDVDTCLQTLQAWAWSGATSNPVSAAGTWADDIPAEPARLGEAEQDALDNVATPLGPPDVDTGKTSRRFIHRSIREHLVAKHLAALPVDQAAEALLPHVWYDRDWEYTAPAAIAMHPKHDQLLRTIVCRAARSDQIPGDLSVIDAGWEFRGLLARVASESSEAAWPPETAGMIAQARAELARSARIRDLSSAVHWETSNRQIRDALLALLGSQTDVRPDIRRALGLVDAVIRLGPTTQDERQARDALLALLSRSINVKWAIYPEDVAGLVRRVFQLAPAAEDKRQARDALLAVLGSDIGAETVNRLVEVVAQLDPTEEGKRRVREALLALLADQTGRRASANLVEGLVDGVAQLATTAEDKRQAREALLALLADQTDSWMAMVVAGGVAKLDPTEEDKRQARDVLFALLGETYSADAAAYGLAQLATTAEDKRQVREALLALLANRADSHMAVELVPRVAQLDPTDEDKHQMREALLALLALLSYPADQVKALQLVRLVVQLATAAEDRRQACEGLVGLLAGQPNRWVAVELVKGVVQLATTAEERRQAREALLRLVLKGQLRSEISAGQPTPEEIAEDKHAVALLVRELVQLDPTTKDRREACEVLLNRLLGGGPTSVPAAELMVRDVAQLAPTVEEKHLAFDALSRLIFAQRDHLVAGPLTGALAQLAATAEDRRQAREGLLGLLAKQPDDQTAEKLVDGMVQLAVTEEDRRQAREGLLELLAHRHGEMAAKLISGMIQLAVTEEDRRQARERLLRLLAHLRDSQTARRLVEWLVDEMIQLDPTDEDKRQARKALLRLLANPTYASLGRILMGTVVELAPEVSDLNAWRDWSIPPTAELLAAVRQNSAPAIWLKALPRLTALSASPA